MAIVVFAPQSNSIMSAGTVKDGAIVSITVIVWTWELVLPQSSAVSHVLVIIYGQPADITSLKFNNRFVVQLSVGIITGTAGMASQWTVTSAGISIIGAMVSLIVIV